MKAVNIIRLGLIAFYALLWVGGVMSYLFMGGPPEDVAWTAPIYLATAALLLLGFAPASERIVLLIGGLIGFAAEILGTHTGFPFGHYEYTAILFPRLFSVPLVLVAAWLLLFAYVRQMTINPLIGALWMTAIDLVIDPLAAHTLGFWTWEKGGWYYDIPWTNFAGWYFVSLLLFAIFRRPAELDFQAQWLGLSIILFFTVIAWGTGLVLAGSVGVALLVLHVVCMYQAKSPPGQRTLSATSATTSHEPGFDNPDRSANTITINR